MSRSIFFDECGFAAAVRSQKADDLSFGRGQIYIFEGGKGTVILDRFLMVAAGIFLSFILLVLLF